MRLEDGTLHNIQWHQNRLEKTYKTFFSGTKPPSLYEIDIPDVFRSGLYKVRVIYARRIVSVDFAPYSRRNITSLVKVYSDSVCYTFKSEDRACIENLRPAGLGCESDFLIIKNGFVTDVSSSTIAFLDGTSWYVPDTPLLPGTSRERLLYTGKVRERRILETDIPDFPSACVFNAMNDFLSITIDTSRIL
ncbi:MAG: aminotransferase class IV [Spirochaetota bacterium]